MFRFNGNLQIILEKVTNNNYNIQIDFSVRDSKEIYSKFECNKLKLQYCDGVLCHFNIIPSTIECNNSLSANIYLSKHIKALLDEGTSLFGGLDDVIKPRMFDILNIIHTVINTDLSKTEETVLSVEDKQVFVTPPIDCHKQETRVIAIPYDSSFFWSWFSKCKPITTK